MAATPAKQRAVALEEVPGNSTWDCADDIYSHLGRKNRILESGTKRLNYFSTLLQEFVVMNPRGDPEMVTFMDGLYGIVKCQLFHLQEQHRDDTAEENDTEEEDDSVIVDPQYEHFLHNLRPDGKSYVLDIIEESVFVKYDYESPPGTPIVCASKNANHVSNEDNVGLDPEMHARTSRNYSGKRRGRKPKPSAAKNPNVNANHVVSEAQKHAPNYTGKRRGRRPKHAVSTTVNGEGVSSVITECFDHKIKVNHTDSDTPSGIATRVKVETEDYDDDQPDIGWPVQDPALNAEHWWHNNEANARKEFREKLMEVLKMPYCQEEYERHLQTITDRKPVQHHKDLRGGIKIYEEDYPGKSFLDHHIDLAKKIDSGRDDHPRVLNLLRGFFYWLTHLSHEGAFLPWRDPSCLDVLPQ